MASHEAGTSRRSVSDEKEDGERVRENVVAADYQDWPNDAGFEGLTEQRGPIELVVKGAIPAWATGSLYRTGPGGFTVEDTKSGTFHISHWFDGLAHTHKFDILPRQDSSVGADPEDTATSRVLVLYSSRRQCEPMIQYIKANGALRSISFGQRSDPCVGMYSKFMTLFHRFDDYNNFCVTVNTNMPGFRTLKEESPRANGDARQGHRSRPGTVFLGSDMSRYEEIDPETLEHLQYVNQEKLSSHLKGPMAPAHGQVDPDTGDYFSVNMHMIPSPTYRVFRVSGADGQTTVLATFKSRAAYIHSFFLTKKYVVVCVPVCHLESGAKLLREGSLVEAMKPFDKSEPCRWYIIDRQNGKGVVGKFHSPAGFFFHSVNAFDDDNGDVVCDVIWFPSSNIISGLYYDVMLNKDGQGKKFWTEGYKSGDSHLRLARWRFSGGDLLTSGEKASKGKKPSPRLELEVLGPHAGELPTINPKYGCHRYRYVYGLASRGFSTLFDSIVKTDLKTREVLIWSGLPGHTPGEAIFVPRPSSDGRVLEEDDGVLLSVVLDGKNRTSYLLCLDAKAMEEMGRAECDFAVGIGFHGQHVGSD